MKFKKTDFMPDKIVLANDHWVGIPIDLTDYESLATDGVIPAGTIIPANDATAEGVLFSSVYLEENPNGTIVVHGFIKTKSIPVEPSAAAKTALNMIKFRGEK